MSLIDRIKKVFVKKDITNMNISFELIDDGIASKDQTIKWQNINEIYLINTDMGPSVCDVFLSISDSINTFIIPQEHEVYEAVYDKVSKYENFNFKNVIESMSCIQNVQFLLWKK